MQVHIPMHSVGSIGSVTVWLKTVIKYVRNISCIEVRAVKLSTRVVAELCILFPREPWRESMARLSKEIRCRSCWTECVLWRA